MGSGTDGSLAGWWGRFTIDEGSTSLWQIGPLRLSLARKEHEWIISYYYLEQYQPDLCKVSEYFEDKKDSGESLKYYSAISNPKVVRFSATRGANQIIVTPRLADRAIIARPEAELWLPGLEEVEIYISSPLWLQISTIGLSLLCEIPILRPSDTWFGNSLIDGELCYAIKTSARLELTELAHRPYRAVTAIRIINELDNPFKVDRIKIPVIHLPLYREIIESGRFWTPGLRFVRERSGNEDRVSVKILNTCSSKAGEVDMINPPRIKPESSNLAMKVIDALI